MFVYEPETTTEEYLLALDAAGVKEWEHYDEAMDNVGDLSDPDEILDTLYEFGLMDWHGYARAQELFAHGGVAA